MPVIKPAKLKQESARLVDFYHESDMFVRELHNLLDRYADRTYRPGQAGEPTSLLPTYNVPPPLLRQITRDLKPLAQTRREESLILCDKLWSEDNFEIRSLAAFLLGQIELTPADPVIERLMKWSDETLDERMVQVLLDNSLIRMRTESQDELFTIAEEWLNSTSTQKNQFAVRVLISMADAPPGENVPLIFRLTTVFIRKTDRELRPYVLKLWRQLALSSPQETAYQLKQNLKAPDNPDVKWYIRNLIPSFPDDLQKSLRESLREDE